ncbi:MAG TPA: acetyltransferase [Edaphocola sp.]|nr:acetyltransferase [Edaphocola sp.]
MKRLAIVGASGHGKVVADIAECCGWEAVEFFDDAYTDQTSMLRGNWPVVGTLSDLLSGVSGYTGVIVAIGDNQVRKSISQSLLAAGANLVTLVHPLAIVSRYAEIGAGSVVVAGAVINAYAVIGSGAIINTGSSIDHDCHLDDYVHISPGVHLAGGVKIRSCCWVGIGACVKQQVTIGANVTVGAGSVVVHNILDNLTVVGVPARPLM